MNLPKDKIVNEPIMIMGFGEERKKTMGNIIVSLELQGKKLIIGAARKPFQHEKSHPEDATFLYELSEEKVINNVLTKETKPDIEEAALLHVAIDCMRDDPKPQQELLAEVNLSMEEDLPRPMYISSSLSETLKGDLLELLRRYDNILA
ncbi:hypothetical protein U1Q18_028104 [Sarracenia purpurea var. burkii]